MLAQLYRTFSKPPSTPATHLTTIAPYTHDTLQMIPSKVLPHKLSIDQLAKSVARKSRIIF